MNKTAKKTSEIPAIDSPFIRCFPSPSVMCDFCHALMDY